MIKRREFIAKSIALAGAAAMGTAFTRCTPSRKITGILSGPNAMLGHKLRAGGFSEPTEILATDVAIIGGGISGLSAARYLSKQNTSFVLLELENKPGGNSSYGENATSAYPLGAHYLTLPGTHDSELLSFLQEHEVITGYEQGKPVFNEYHLCFDPKERLYIHGQWQEGVLPQQGVPAKDMDEIKRFLQLMAQYKETTGADGLEAFCLPIDFCSKDPEFLKLDAITFRQFLTEQSFTSPFLLWYLNYCTADDFGASIDQTSAWAGIHYFACHKATGFNAPSDAVLTWPEGNGWLVKKLKLTAATQTKTNCLVYNVSIKDDKVEVQYFDASTGKTKLLLAKKAIIATPQFINQRIVSGNLSRTIDYTAFTYAPWMVANLTVHAHLNENRGEKLSWDNVIYGSSSLGYVHANHQHVQQHSGKSVLTFYMPLINGDARNERQRAYDQSYQQWYDTIVNELKQPHKEIEQSVENMDVWIWGHGMIRPTPGFITGTPRLLATAPISHKICFAHSDLSGISVFEEAFYRGTQAAKWCLRNA